jgi:uncharacterized protein (TIGR02145 family)
MKAAHSFIPVLLVYLTGSLGLSYTGYSQACKGKSAITDSRDGQVYPIVQIGSQCWLQKNMEYMSGSSVCLFREDLSECDTVWGKLYDWETATIVCPRGWHLPSLDEFKVLVNYLGGPDIAGGKMKERDTIHWSRPNAGATNESGFTARAAGYYQEPSLYGLKDNAYFWTSSEVNIERAYLLTLDNDLGSVGYNDWKLCTKEFYFSVRCIRD